MRRTDYILAASYHSARIDCNDTDPAEQARLRESERALVAKRDWHPAGDRLEPKLEQVAARYAVSLTPALRN